MFQSEIGPTGYIKGYLRPETAQGIFLNFRRLIEFNNGKMPFAGAQMGLGFRNEIHPRQGLLRVREFQMAEIEHFVDPLDKSHSKFHLIENDVLPLWTAANQEVAGPVISDVTLKEAVEKNYINNQTLAYFMARTFAFLKQCGIAAEGIRFRQHRSNEMAHYAQDCWDAEVETSYGWIEVAGHADRSCFDLTKHAEKTKVELNAARVFKEKRLEKYFVVTSNKKDMGKLFKKDLKKVNEAIESFTDEDKLKYMAELAEKGEITLTIEGQEFKLTKELLTIEQKERMVNEEKFIPHVIEPSFGIGRILYCIFEHSFKIRPQDAQRTYFNFPIVLAPAKCVLLPLTQKPELSQKTVELKTLLTRAGLHSKIDDSGANVGKRYARTDECGIPYAFTVDFTTLEDETVTMRELETMKQIRLPLKDAPEVLNNLSSGFSTWDDVLGKYPNVEA